MNITGNTKGGKPEKNQPHVNKPVNSVKEDIEAGNIKPVKNPEPAKQREQSEQPVHSVKKAPKDN
ncbi:hypothetical protein [Pedobacter sp.]